MTSLKGKIALITGGTRGIGRTIVEEFSKEEASIAFFGTNESLGKEVKESLEPQLKEGQKISFYKVDVSDFGAVKEGINQVLSDFGSIDVVVNNAGITRDNLLMKMTEEEWDKVLDTNLKSIFYICQTIIRPMLKARKGKIINITSISGIAGNAGQTNYAASKAGMIGFTKSLAKEAASRNIQVNCIAPGFIETDMSAAIAEEKKKSFIDSIPLQRFGKTEDIAYAAIFLASDRSNYITGQVLTIDGGLVMGIGG